jgi:hypothetical protein
MSVDARGGDRPDRTDDDDQRARDGGAHDAPALCVNVVRYPDEPDRVTLSPCEVSAGDHTTTWLSVNADAVVSLADAR